MPKLTSFSVNIGLPYIGSIEGTWQPDEQEKQAAWEMYIELVTRAPVATLHLDHGVLRETLTSMYSLFDTTREILRRNGPGVAQIKHDSKLSFGYLSIAILNVVLRPFLSKWHPSLKAYEETRPLSIDVAQYEQNWERYRELQEELLNVRTALISYTNLLAKVAGVSALIVKQANS